MRDLIRDIHNCKACAAKLPHHPNPIVQISKESKILIIGQAPGRRVHETGIPWNDPSGNKLRTWLGVSSENFYDPSLFSIVPMGFCYPGKGKSGDLPPMPECAKLWHQKIIEEFESSPLIILIGQYAQRHYLKETYRGNLTETVKNYQEYLPTYFPLPHPSPRNQNWLKVNPWFSNEVLPALKETVRHTIQHHKS